MIKIYAKNKGNEVNLKIKVIGRGSDIIHEAASILTKLPEQIGAANPVILTAVTDKVAEKAAEMFGEDPDEAEEAETDDQ